MNKSVLQLRFVSYQNKGFLGLNFGLKNKVKVDSGWIDINEALLCDLIRAIRMHCFGITIGNFSVSRFQNEITYKFEHDIFVGHEDDETYKLLSFFNSKEFSNEKFKEHSFTLSKENEMMLKMFLQKVEIVNEDSKEGKR